jgi:hypothetical protein
LSVGLSNGHAILKIVQKAATRAAKKAAAGS